MGELLSLAVGFFVVGLVSFGGGQAALPLVERIAVSQHGWVSPSDFATGVGLAYATPGPVLILATFVGYRVEGLPGALTATVAVFAAPVVLAAGAASVVARLSGAGWFRTFGRYAGAAAVGLLAVTLVSLSGPVTGVHPALLLLAVVVAATAWRGVSPLLLLAVAVAIGAAVGFAAA